MVELDVNTLKQLITEAVREALAAQTAWPRWLTLREACQYARVSRNTLLKLIDEGHIAAKRLEGKWIVDRLSIDRFYAADDDIVELHVRSML